MSNKTSDNNVANIEIIENFIFELKSFGLNKDTLEVANELENLLSDYTRQKQINEEHKRINGELREKVKELERNSNCDSVYAIKFATMQQQINEKDKRIQELEKESRKKSIELICYQEELENSISKQVVIDKINEINKAYEESKDENGESPYYYPDYTVRVLQEFLEGESK